MNKLIAQIQKICALGTPNITLTRSQVTRLLDYAEKTAAKSRDGETKRLRLAMHRAEEALQALTRRTNKDHVITERTLDMVRSRLLMTARKDGNASK